MAASWFVLCRVVDHYGDAGVCWRLAQQLANEHGLDVTLFIDDLATLQRLLPALNSTLDRQHIDGVTVRRLTDTLPTPFSTSSVSVSSRWPNVIIDAFGGGLPPTWLAALEHDFPPLDAGITSKPNAPHWIILEYLSAEPWVETLHGRTSPPPSIGIPRHFFFPGFTEKTGGLLREKNLLEARDVFQSSSDAKRAFLESLGAPVPPPGALLVSLFCYDTPALPALLDAWATNSSPIVGLVPETVAPETLRRWRQQHDDVETNTTRTTHGNLTLHTIPFLPQSDFDKLLWSCDLNFVRGEDSFVRAQWAARPFVWQAYRQEEQVHLAKVEAFLALYLAGATDSLKSALSGFSQAWNDNEQAGHIADAWSSFMEQWPALASLPHDWAHRLSIHDLVHRLTLKPGN